MLTLGAEKIKTVTPTVVTEKVTVVTDKLFSFGFVTDLYTKIDDLSKPVATTVTDSATKVSVWLPKKFQTVQTTVDTYVPPLAQEKPRPKAVVKIDALPCEAWSYAGTVFLRGKTHTVAAVTSAPEKAIAFAKAKYTEATNCDCAKNALKKVESYVALVKTDYVLPAKKSIIDFGTPLATKAESYVILVKTDYFLPAKKAIVDSDYYAYVNKQYQYYNKAALPYYNAGIKKGEEILKTWPISVLVEYFLLAKASVQKYLPVQWVGCGSSA